MVGWPRRATFMLGAVGQCMRAAEGSMPHVSPHIHFFISLSQGPKIRKNGSCSASEA